MPTTKKINANGTEISILLQGNENDYICLNFNPIEFDAFRDQTHTGSVTVTKYPVPVTLILKNNESLVSIKFR